MMSVLNKLSPAAQVPLQTAGIRGCCLEDVLLMGNVRMPERSIVNPRHFVYSLIACLALGLSVLAAA
jgi:hypothetical protein